MHDPAQAPDPAWWLSLDEITRGDELRDFHAAYPNPTLHGMHPNLDLHCSMHAVVETQVAEQDPPIVAATVARLEAEALNRHAVMHAIMDKLVLQMHASMTSGAPFDGEAYAQALLGIQAADIVAEGIKRGQAAYASEESDRPALNRAQRRAMKKKKR